MMTTHVTHQFHIDGERIRYYDNQKVHLNSWMLDGLLHINVYGENIDGPGIVAAFNKESARALAKSIMEATEEA